MQFPGDYDYIFEIINYLSDKHRINFFITSKDFDVLYGWWEKRIPLEIIKKSIDNVKRRWDSKQKTISGFSNFSYEVRKRNISRMELNVNMDVAEIQTENTDSISEFFENFPVALSDLESDMKEIPDIPESEREIFIEKIYDKLIDRFSSDSELNLKTEVFLKNISEQLRKPEIIRRYKINFLKKRFKIPDFDLK